MENKTICAACGHENEGGQKFCNECGAKLELSKTNAKCPSCGHENPAGDKFCGECGAKLDAAPSIQEGLCPNCGIKLDPGTKFCRECGAVIEGGAEEKPAPKQGELVMLDSNFPFSLEGFKITGDNDEEKTSFNFNEYVKFKIPPTLNPRDGGHECFLYAIKHTDQYKGSYDNDSFTSAEIGSYFYSPRYGTDIGLSLDPALCLDGLYDFVLTYDREPVAYVTLEFILKEE